MTNRNVFLLKTYFKQGWLSRRYFNGQTFLMPYCAEDRLHAGELFYADYIHWLSGQNLVVNYEKLKVDGSSQHLGLSPQAERFRKALRLISKACLPVIYKIVLEEKIIPVPENASERERLYLNDEIKCLLCRGLDDLCRFYS